MPFASQAQRAWMFSTHPQMAKRWEAVTPKSGGLPAHALRQMDVRPHGTPSNETWEPSKGAVPRKPGVQRDYGMLKPSASARFKPASRATPNELESSREEGVKYFHGSRHRELGTPKPHRGFHARDVREAIRAKKGEGI